MKTVYQTIDGRIFGEASDATKHESAILAKVNMWDWNKERTTNTAQAKLIHLVGEHAGAIFKAMVAANPEEYGPIDDAAIDDEDNGWYFWDEFYEAYRYIDDDTINLIVAANHEI